MGTFQVTVIGSHTFTKSHPRRSIYVLSEKSPASRPTEVNIFSVVSPFMYMYCSGDVPNRGLADRPEKRDTRLLKENLYRREKLHKIEMAMESFFICNDA